MTLKDVNNKELIENIRRLVAAECRLPATFKVAIELLITLCILLIEGLPKKIKK